VAVRELEWEGKRVKIGYRLIFPFSSQVSKSSQISVIGNFQSKEGQFSQNSKLSEISQLSASKLNGKEFSIPSQFSNSPIPSNFHPTSIFSNANLPKILFLHGWGGRRESMEPFIPFFSNAIQLYVDLPGFGSSTLPFPLKTIDYTSILRQFLEEFPFQPDLIVAHSFGGKVGLLLTPPNLLLLGSAGIPVPKPFSVRLKIATFKILKKIGLGKFRDWFISRDVRGVSPALYQTFKQVVDEDFRPYFQDFKGKVVIFGGKEDRAVPPVAIGTQGKLMGIEPIFLSGNHFFYLEPTNLEVIARKGWEMLENG